jgi:hypothetical protein
MAVSRASTARARSYPGGHQSQTGSRWTFHANLERVGDARDLRDELPAASRGANFGLPPSRRAADTGRLVWAQEKGYNTAKARRADGYVDRPLLRSEQAELVDQATRLALS